MHFLIILLTEFVESEFPITPPFVIERNSLPSVIPDTLSQYLRVVTGQVVIFLPFPIVL